MYCVYIHTNKVNGKKYVGQTCQQPHKRWGNGKYYRPETYFGKAIAKYGWDNFDHDIIAENLTKEEANNLEVTLIAKYKTNNSQYGYNLTTGGEGTAGIQRSQEYRKKQRLSQTGKQMSKDTRKRISAGSVRRRGAVLQYSITGEFIKEWDCMATAMLALNTNHIPEVCKGKRKTAAGFVWKLKDENTLNVAEQTKSMCTSTDSYNKLSPVIACQEDIILMPIYQYDLKYNLINVFNNYDEAAIVTGIKKTNIANNVLGYRRTTFGFIFTDKPIERKISEVYDKQLVAIDNGRLVHVQVQPYSGPFQPTLNNPTELFSCTFTEDTGELTMVQFSNKQDALAYFDTITDHSVDKLLSEAKRVSYIVSSTSKIKNKIDFTPVVCVETGICYVSMREASRQTQAPHCSILRACKNPAKTAGNLHWKFYKE